MKLLTGTSGSCNSRPHEPPERPHEANRQRQSRALGLRATWTELCAGLPIEAFRPMLDLSRHIGRWGLTRFGFASRMVPTSVGALHVYEAAGRRGRPTIVVLHGLGVGAAGYTPLLLRLVRCARRVIAPDFLAHGFSESPRLELSLETMMTGLVEALDQVLDE